MSVIRQNDIIVKYNIQDLEKTSQSFIERFEALSVLKKDEKLFIDESLINRRPILTIDNSDRFMQSFSRWWYDQGRENLHSFIVKEFNDYLLFIDMIYMANKSSHNNVFEQAAIEEIISKHKNFFKLLIKGFAELKLTYQEYTPLKTTLTTIQQSLNEKFFL
jgi:hypothetical protein